MADLKNITALSINGKSISLHELLYYLKIDGKIDLLLEDTINDLLISQAAEREGVTVSDEELQDALDTFRQGASLQKKVEMENWLKQKNMTIDDIEIHLERNAVAAKLKDKIVAGEKVNQYFAENRPSFDTANISHILVEKEGVAHELFSQVTVEDVEFSSLARKYSIDNDSKDAGGYIGSVNRKTLSPVMESAVFGARDGDVVGPVSTDMGYHIIKVEKVQIGELDDNVKEKIKDELFSNWLKEEARDARIDLKLITLI